MKLKQCESCGKPLGEEYYDITIRKRRFGVSAGPGRIVGRIGGHGVCEACMHGIVEACHGNAELQFVRKYNKGVDHDRIIALHNEGLRIADIVRKTGYSRTTVDRTVKQKKAVSEKI